MPRYSGTPLVKKLGIKAGAKLYVKNTPIDYTALVGQRGKMNESKEQ